MTLAEGAAWTGTGVGVLGGGSAVGTSVPGAEDAYRLSFGIGIGLGWMRRAFSRRWAICAIWRAIACPWASTDSIRSSTVFDVMVIRQMEGGPELPQTAMCLGSITCWLFVYL